MAQPGYSLLVRKGGFATTMTNEATTILGSTSFRITDATRRVMDPNQPWHLKVGTTSQAYTVISSVDFVSGEIELKSAAASASLTFTGKYIPITTATDVMFETRSFSLTDSNDLLDKTVFTGTTNDRVRKRLAGLNDVDLTVESLMSKQDMAYLSTVHFNGSQVVTEVYFGDATLPRFRGFCKIESIEYSGNVEDLLTTNIAFKIAAVHDTVSNQVAAYTFTVQENS
jgi:hypothetical protein